jgi:hypothetical protein
MKVLSIDVGIKNLAFCLLNGTSIHKWDCINIAEQEPHKCGFIEKTEPCNKPAKFSKNGKCFCLKHAKKQTFQIPTAELNPSYINKQKIQKLYELSTKYNLKYEVPTKKCDLVAMLNEYSASQCFQPVQETNASKIDLITVGRNIKIRFDQIFDSNDKIDCVLIENQISPIANRMKTIQGMIAQYFIMKDTNQRIEFFSSANKLKQFDEDSQNGGKKMKKEKDDTSYSDRKKMGVSKCLELLQADNINCSFIEYFQSHKKKDDLADSYLQGCAYLKRF